MKIPLTTSRSGRVIPVDVVSSTSLRRHAKSLKKKAQNWLKDSAFTGKSGQLLRIPGNDGAVERVLLGASAGDFWAFSALAKLPKGKYEIASELDAHEATQAAVAFGLGCYRFERYKASNAKPPTLLWPQGANTDEALGLVEGVALARDLINTPANDMGPAELAEAAVTLAKEHGAKTKVVVGDALLKSGFPAVHAVGRASVRAPRLVDLRWGNPKHPKITLVGKGVCFDTGGLDLKSASNMKMMKKDMGGAAFVLGLAHAIMKTGLPVCLRVLVPAVENSVDGNAMRPLDVLQTRKGLTVEVGNTDAEGRLILSDALTEAASEDPELVLDAATLTGAARVALGTALPALFTNQDDWAAQILSAGRETHDPLWQLPLHEPYRGQLDSSIADLNNIGNTGYGGAITAALFLREFVEKKTPWVHVDTMGYNNDSKAGRPKGGEAMALRAIYHALKGRYAAAGDETPTAR